jgi:fructose 1,6-bisphosphate aldolase/phosphatase
MITTLTAMRADIGSIGGHLKPSARVVAAVEDFLGEHKGEPVIDYALITTGDDITVLCSHTGGCHHAGVHELMWQAFANGAETAIDEGLYGAGQDLFKEGISGVAKGLGPAVAEMEITERANEAFLLFSLDKCLPGALNLPFYLAFADPMHCPGLMLSPRMKKGFRFDIMDVLYKAFDRRITLEAPEDMYNIAALLRDEERFAIRTVYSRTTDEQALALSTTRLHHIAGFILGKDDPVAIVRVQDAFPATGEILAPFAIGPYVSGSLRGSYYGPLMPMPLNSGVSFFDGPPAVSCAAFCVSRGRLTPALDVFDHPVWDQVRERLSEKAMEIRRQGFFGNAMKPFEALSYGGIVKILRELDERFVLEKPENS